MNRMIGGAVLMAIGVVAVSEGCEINPYDPPTHAELIPSTSSGGFGGMWGTGGQGGAGAATSSSGKPCMCTDDGNECTEDATGECPNGDAEQCHKAIANKVCPSGWCSDTGECKECQTCTDPASCGDRCLGVQCKDNLDCKSNVCQTIANAPSICCDKPCGLGCWSCDRPGVEGTCTRMPVGFAYSYCAGGSLCDANGVCSVSAKAALGALCSVDNDCASGRCKSQYCRSQVNEPCIDHLECETNLCDPVAKTCRSCISPGGPSCPEESVCDTGTGSCKAAPGQPGAYNPNDPSKNDCLAGNVAASICALAPGTECSANSQCASRNCVNKTCSDFCTTSGQCIAGTKCVNGSCTLEAGNYCIEAWLCDSGKCEGFPPRCQ